jgi:hypothetical protein
MTRPWQTRAMLAVAALVTISVTGCSKGLPTGPSVDGTGNSAVAVEDAKASASVGALSAEWTWYQVASQWVNKGAAATVSGGRSSVQFVRGSLGVGATVTLSERDPAASDVKVGPHGMALSKAATLTISYAGTPSEVMPTALKFFRFNDTTGQWVAMAATHDPAAKTLSAKISVLGRFAVSIDPTKAGW